MAERLFEPPEQAKLPNPHFRPGVVWLRRCADCGALDDRAWYPTSEAATGASGQGQASWGCRRCCGRESIVTRDWFDTAFDSH